MWLGITVQERKFSLQGHLKIYYWLYHVFIKKECYVSGHLLSRSLVYLYSSLKMIKIVYIVSHYFLSYNISVCKAVTFSCGVTEKRHDFGVSGQKAIFLSFLVGSLDPVLKMGTQNL